MSIKDNLSNLITSNGYDINNDEVRNALLSLVGNNVTNLPLNKKHIVIRILSKEEYDKYIINGSLDGSITIDNENVFHRITRQLNPLVYCTSPNNVNYCYDSISTFFVPGNWDVSRSFCKFTNPRQYAKVKALSSNFEETTEIQNNIFELFSTNENSKFTINFNKTIKYEVATSERYSNGHFYKMYYNSIDVTFKFIPKNNSVLSSTVSTWGQGGASKTNIQINQICCYRPVFNFVDNNKSKIIYY